MELAPNQHYSGGS